MTDTIQRRESATFNPPDHAGLQRRDWALAGLFCAAIAAAYALLHGIYRPENIDDAWFLSFARNYTVRGIETDTVFGGPIGQGGYGGVALFGKAFALAYAQPLNWLGWTKSNAHLVSTVFLALSAACWFGILRRLRYATRLAAFFALALLIVEPFFGAANQARPDAMCFLLVSLSLLLFLWNRHFAAALTALLAIETHPAGITAFVYMAALFLLQPRQVRRDSRRTARMFALVGAGIAAGAAIYAGLHHSYLALLPSTLFSASAGGDGGNNFLFEYFFRTKYYRHVPELAAILACGGWFLWKKHHTTDRAVPFLLAAALVAALLVRRPSFMYTIYVYPAFLLLILRTFEISGRLRFAVVLLLFYLLPQYGMVYAANRHWNMSRYVADVTASVPNDSLPVVGNPNDWFAFMDRRFVAVQRPDFAGIGLQDFYLIEHDDYRAGKNAEARAFVARDCDSREVARFRGNREDVAVMLVTRKSDR